MSLRARVLKGAAALSAGQAVSQGLSFVRNVIVARLISPENFGIAATFALTVSLLEMISDLAADKLLIQARDGDSEALLATAQLWQFTRGVVSALLIAAVAWPMARLFKVPQAQWAFYWLALVPLLRGCVHLDIKRLQRHMRFGPQVLTDVGSQVVIVAAAWPLAYWLRSYSAMLWLLIAQAAALAALSHVLAERRYRWRYDREQARRLVAFGWPLLLNGLLMFGIFEGDRLIVGASYGMHDLGTYSAAFALAAAPTTILGSVAGAMILPILSRHQDDANTFQRHYISGIQVLASISGVLVVAFMLLHSRLMLAVYGQSYAGVSLVLTWLGVMQTLRLVRSAPIGAGMALGDSKNPLLANCWRVGAVPAALLMAVIGAPLYSLAICGCVGELVAFVASARRLEKRCSVPRRAYFGPAGFMLTAALAAGIVSVLLRTTDSLFVYLLGWAVTSLGVALLAVVVFDSSRRELLALWRAFRSVRAEVSPATS